MKPRTWSLTVALACVGLVTLAALHPGGRSLGWRQSSEGNGYRSDEYGLMGVTLYQTNQPVPGLRVEGDFLTVLASTGLKNPSEIMGQAKKADRTVRREGTQYWLRMDTATKPQDIIDAYKPQLKSHIAMPGGEEVEGRLPRRQDSRSRLRGEAVQRQDGRVADLRPRLLTYSGTMAVTLTAPRRNRRPRPATLEPSRNSTASPRASSPKGSTVELIDGQFYTKMPQGLPHLTAHPLRLRRAPSRLRTELYGLDAGSRRVKRDHEARTRSLRSSRKAAGLRHALPKSLYRDRARR